MHHWGGACSGSWARGQRFQSWQVQGTVRIPKLSVITPAPIRSFAF